MQINNIIKKEPVRLVLFTLILKDNENNIFQKYEKYLSNSKHMDLFSNASSYFQIDKINNIIPIGNKQKFLNYIRGKNIAYRVSLYRWSMLGLVDQTLIETDSFKNKDNQHNYLKEYIDDYASYIKEYFIKKTNKKQFSKVDLKEVVLSLIPFFLDMSSILLINAGHITKRTIVSIEYDPSLSNEISIDNILPLTIFNKEISFQDKNNSEKYNSFINAINLLRKKFNNNLTSIEHILKIGFERYMVFMNEYADLIDERSNYMEPINQKTVDIYNILSGIRLIDERFLNERSDIGGKSDEITID